MRSETRGTLAILGSSLGYGALAILAKLALDRGVAVIPLLTWRFLVASAVIWPVALWRETGMPRGSGLLGIAGLGVLYAVDSLAFMVGLARIPASLASLIFFTYPVVTVLFARVWLGERLTRRRATSLVAAASGCALIVGKGFSTLDVAGVVWILIAVISIACFIILSHGTLARVPPLGGTAMILTTTAVILTGVALQRGELAVPTDTTTLELVAALGIVSTAIPVTLFLLGIQWIGPARAAIFSTMEPVITVALAAAVLGERLLGVQLVGGALILLGVIWLRLERYSVETGPH